MTNFIYGLRQRKKKISKNPDIVEKNITTHRKQYLLYNPHC